MSSAASSLQRGPQLWRRLALVEPWLRNPPPAPSPAGLSNWSPRNILATVSSTVQLTVKQQPRRFFMYEEHAASKLTSSATDYFEGGGPTKIFSTSPTELASFLHTPAATKKGNDTDHTTKNSEKQAPQFDYYYWTSPIKDVAPHLLEYLPHFEDLHPPEAQERLDPRGPSLWMGNAGTATQAHYDVADNVLVQLWGRKRIRIWPPTAARSLHVFPDAHARARKAQVNLDDHHPESSDAGRFPHWAQLSPPVLDCLLQPGDALSIPAFWFHHVENSVPVPGTFPNHEPSVSVNLFARSEAMMVAQDVFRAGRRPFRHTGAASSEGDRIATVAVLLQALTWRLCADLGIDDPHALIRTDLLDTRYTPLHHFEETTRLASWETTPLNRSLTNSETRQLERCLGQIVPPLEWLARHGDDGVVSLVVCHLLELWAVELVGADSVQTVWEAVLRVNDGGPTLSPS